MPVRQSMTDFEIRSVLLFAALTLSTASNLWAQSTAAPMPDDNANSALFAQVDTNKDKQLSMQEAKAVPGLEEQFSKVDANADGMISEQEFIAAMGPAQK